MKQYRPDLPPIPEPMRSLTVDRGYPVPWFVPWEDGKPEFRLADQSKLIQAVQGNLCWLCGQKLSAFASFVIGPMCTVNRVSSEPPAHLGCAKFAVKSCPFLLDEMERREGGLPSEVRDAPGVMVKRNPGVSAIWTTKGAAMERVDHGVLFRLWEPTQVLWYTKGRAATRAEVLASIESGLLFLQALCEGPDDEAELLKLRKVAEAYLPKS